MSSGLISLRINDLLKRLLCFGVTWRQRKGSEVVLSGYIFGATQDSNNFRRYRVGTHTQVINRHTVMAILRRFKIKEDDFLANNH